jgi:hypothetical protein
MKFVKPLHEFVSLYLRKISAEMSEPIRLRGTWGPTASGYVDLVKRFPTGTFVEIGVDAAEYEPPKFYRKEGGHIDTVLTVMQLFRISSCQWIYSIQDHAYNVG